MWERSRISKFTGLLIGSSAEAALAVRAMVRTNGASGSPRRWSRSKTSGAKSRAAASLESRAVTATVAMATATRSRLGSPRLQASSRSSSRPSDPVTRSAQASRSSPAKNASTSRLLLRPRAAVVAGIAPSRSAAATAPTGHQPSEIRKGRLVTAAAVSRKSVSRTIWESTWPDGIDIRSPAKQS
jgi:hypothetical protein